MFGDVTGAIVDMIIDMGYPGVFIVMVIDSIGLPIPGEMVLPYAGFMASDEGFIQLLLVSAMGSLGTGVGSAVGYGVGRWGGRPFIEKYCKFMGISQDKVLWAERFFHKYGESACCYTRLLPVVRNVVNVPAGLLNMNFFKFMAYTMIGAFPWCLGLSSVGYLMGDNWESIMGMAQLVTYAFLGVIAIAALAAAILYVLIKRGIVRGHDIKRYVGLALHV